MVRGPNDAFPYILAVGGVEDDEGGPPRVTKKAEKMVLGDNETNWEWEDDNQLELK